jgi:hypothetical protein
MAQQSNATDEAQVETGDHIIGESAIYKVLDGGDSISVASVTRSAARAEESVQKHNSGDPGAELLRSLGTRVPRADLNKVVVSDGDTLIWDAGREVKATVSIDGDGSVALTSDSELVPEQFGDVLGLKCHIALGYARFE